VTHKAEVQKVKLLKITLQNTKSGRKKDNKMEGGLWGALGPNGNCRRRQNKQSALLVRPDLMKGPGKLLPAGGKFGGGRNWMRN